MAKQKKSSKKILPKLTESNYYSNEADLYYMSVSQYKSFMKCEAETMAKIRGEYKEPITKALLVGSFVDSYFEGTLEQFMKDNPEIFTKQEELRADFRRANEIISRIKTDKTFMNFLSGEKQKILTFELFGIHWKIKIDSFIPDKCIVDLKTSRRTEELPKWRYDIQGAVYQKGVELNGLGTLPFYLAVATKEKVSELNIFQIPQSTLDLTLMEVGENIPHIMEVKSGKIEPTRCGKCAYCKATKVTKIRNYNELLEGQK